MNPQPPALLLPWRAQTNKALYGTDWALLASLAMVPRGSIPDFMCPPPATALPSFNDELTALRQTPENVIRSELRIACGDTVPCPLMRAMDEPRIFARQLADLIEQFWSQAIAPQWALLRARLEGEMLYRARTLALGGVEELFSGLHKDVSLREDRLLIRTLSHWNGRERQRGLLLIPSVFSWPDVFLTVRPPWRTAIIYPSRGIADLWDNSSLSSLTGLQQLVGPSCAKVIAKLEIPRTTLEMSAALGLSPAATSEQITKLRNVGILVRTRIGRRVFYSLNQKGKILMATFSA